MSAQEGAERRPHRPLDAHGSALAPAAALGAAGIDPRSEGPERPQHGRVATPRGFSRGFGCDGCHSVGRRGAGEGLQKTKVCRLHGERRAKQRRGGEARGAGEVLRQDCQTTHAKKAQSHTLHDFKVNHTCKLLKRSLPPRWARRGASSARSASNARAATDRSARSVVSASRTPGLSTCALACRSDKTAVSSFSFLVVR